MKTTTAKNGATTTTTKTIVSKGVTIGVSRRVVNVRKPFISELEYSIEYKKFSKTRMDKHSFKFHLEMIKEGRFD